jgi:3-deoxy-manno-octulosonate cytidylyltransferase (CMP-KDO synthetase)
MTDQGAVMDDSVVKVTISENNEVLYYSRLPTLYSRGENNLNEVTYYRCLGLYLYSRIFLSKYSLMSVTKLESTEKIEQLRVLENGIMINAVKVRDTGISVDTLNDLRKVRDLYENGGCKI